MKDNKVNVEAIEVDSHHVFIELVSRSCSVGQLVALEGHIIYPTTNESFEASGKIVMIKEITEGHDKIGIELHSFDKKKWGEFIHFLNKQQDELDRLFRSMRDDE